MRPTKQAQKNRVIVASLISVCIGIGILQPVYAATPSKSQLTTRQTAIQQKIGRVQQQLRQVKAKERQTRVQVQGAQKQVRLARGQLREATLRLQQARLELAEANQQLFRAQHALNEAQQQAGNHIRASYERGDIGYLDYLLTAQDMGDLIERIQRAEFLKEQDRAVIEELKVRRAQVQQFQQTVKVKTNEVALWQGKVAVYHQRAVVKQVSAEKTLKTVSTTRRDYEAEYATLMRDSAAVTSMLRKLQGTTAGRKRYNTKYTGTVSGLPVNGRITSGFGYRIHPIRKDRRLHTGVDIAAASGTAIGAAGGGEVIAAGWRGGYGNCVIIDHGKGKTTLYAHMSRINVSVGKVVARNATIGWVGSTGLSTGPHLHYEVRINGTPVNPL